MPTKTSRERSKNSGQGTAAHGGHAADDCGGDRPDQISRSNSHGHEHSRDPRPLTSYAGIMASYGGLTTGLILLLRRKRFRIRLLSPWNFVLYALAAEHISRLISKDSVTSPIRKPFTEFEEPAGEGEVNEDVIGSGPRHAIGELLTCPFCLDQWVTTGLVAGSVAAPTLTTAVVTVSALARTADYLHLLYGLLRERVD
jgi:Protein of unknown function (DUF1360)